MGIDCAAMGDQGDAASDKAAAEKAEPESKAAGKGAPAAEQRDKSPWPLRIAVIALALSIAFFVWAVKWANDDEESASEPPPAPAQTEVPRIVSEEALADVASNVGHDVYWAGPIPDTELEVTEGEDGSVLVRYLEDGAEVGEGQAEFLTIGSYPLVDTKKTMEEFAEQPGAIVRQTPDGREVMTTKQRPTNVYFATLDEVLQIEVFDPSPARAMNLARSGDVQPAN